MYGHAHRVLEWTPGPKEFGVATKCVLRFPLPEWQP